jgi:drug/metabolite transporter (DMT)-like permease
VKSWLVLIGYGTFSQCLAWAVISVGLSKIPASRAGLLLLLQPTLAYTWDVLFFEQRLTLWQAFGAFLALFAIYAGQAVRKSNREGN